MSNLEPPLHSATGEEKYWALLRPYLRQLREAERRFIEALAVFHWFDDHIAEYVWTDLGQDVPYLEAWDKVIALPFVGTFAGRGLAFHKLYRNALLFRLWRDRREQFLEAAGRAADYFEPGDPFLKVERAYHLLISDPPAGRAIHRDLVMEFQDTGSFNPWHTLNLYGLEHIGYKRLDSQSAALVWESAGQFSSLHGKNEKAIGQLKSSQSLYEQTDDQAGLIRVLYSNAAYQSFVGRAEACKADLQRAYDIALEMENPLYAGYIMYRIAEQVQYEGNPVEAHSLYERSLDWFEVAGDYAMQARDLKFIAETTDGKLAEVRKSLYEKALPLFEQGWARYNQMALDDSGFSHVTFIGGFASRKKVKLFRLFNTAIDEGDCLMSLAELEEPGTRISLYERSLVSYQRALPLAQQMKDLRWTARANLRLGDVYLQLEQPEGALPYYRQALEDAERVDRTLYIGWAYVGLADIARLAGDQETARGYYRQALELYLKEGAHSNIGWQIKPKLGRASFWVLYLGHYLRRLTAVLKASILGLVES